MLTYAAMAVLVSVAALTLRSLGKSYSTAVVMAGTVLLCLTGVRLLEPIIQEITAWGEWFADGGEMLDIILSLTGTALVSDAACSLCRQAGEEELAQACAWIAKIILLGMALPVLLDLLEFLHGSFLLS